MWTWYLGMAIGFVAMEPLSWAIHKYIMHGPLWKIHQTHHIHKSSSFWELNDLFSLFFCLFSVILIVIGLQSGSGFTTGIGSGIAMFGTVYFIFHDLLIHRRIRTIRKQKFSGLAGRIVKAHLIHHKSTKDPNSKYFGFLFIKDRYPN